MFSCALEEVIKCKILGHISYISMFCVSFCYEKVIQVYFQNLGYSASSYIAFLQYEAFHVFGDLLVQRKIFDRVCR